MNNMHPQKLKQNTVIESSLDLRCNFSQPFEVIAVYLLNAFSDQALKGLERLPIMDLPEVVRMNDPNLKNAPLYQITTKSAVLQIAKNGIRYINRDSYPGWNAFVLGLNNFLKVVISSKTLESMNRISLRYINFLEADASSVCKVSFNSGLDFERIQFNHTDIFRKDSYIIKTVIANEAKLNNLISGSLLDIDVSCAGSLSPEFGTIVSRIEEMHNLCRLTYFSSLSSEFLEKLGPTNE